MGPRAETTGTRAEHKSVTVPWVAAARERAQRGEPCPPLVMVTAYDYPQGRTADAAGADIVLVGDSLAMVVLGHADTLAVTMEEMLHHTRAVRRGVKRALLVGDMPYGSFHLGAEQAVANALRFVKEAGAQAVKIEGARPEIVAAMVGAEVPVMAHLGLTPQSFHRLGGFKVQGREAAARRAIVDAACQLEEAGAFALVLEAVPVDLAAEITARLSIPTIGIGAGPHCGGQVLVYHDLLGMEERIAPRFVRRYAELGKLSREALARFAEDVRARRFPDASESYGRGPAAAAPSPAPGTAAAVPVAAPVPAVAAPVSTVAEPVPSVAAPVSTAAPVSAAADPVPAVAALAAAATSAAGATNPATAPLENLPQKLYG